jgi:hypothetical protein
VGVEPEDKAAEALAAHIRGSGHAFSMFDAARLVLAENDRFHVRFTCAAERNQLLNVTADGGVFLSHDEALQHVLRGPALEQFYRVEEVELEEPKGDFKSIGVCGMTGELLGPPSHHSFQTSLIRLHRDRFSHMPLDEYKRRVRVESNPELVAQWKEKQRKGYRWVALKDAGEEGAEAPAFANRSDMETHFRRTHAHEAVKEVKEAVVPGNIDKSKLTHVLSIMLRHAVENARKHLFEMSQKLGGNFERRGLKLFKRRAGKLFVSRVKPRAVDQGVVLSDRVSRIVEVLKTQPGMPLHQLVESICPSPAPGEGEAPPAEGAAPKPPTEEQISVIKDVRWLANEGYVIEYSDGMVFLGVQGEPNPPKAAKQQKLATETPGESAPEATEAEAAETLAEETATDGSEPSVAQPVSPKGDEEFAAAEQPGETETATAAAPNASIESAEAETMADSAEEAESEEESPPEPEPSPAPGEPAPVEQAPGEKTPDAEVTEEAAADSDEASTDISAAEEPVPPMGEESEKASETP